MEKGRIEFTDPNFRPRDVTPNELLTREWCKRLRFKPHDAPCICVECENFLTGWDMGFAHRNTLATQERSDLQAQKEWFEGLKDAIERDDKEIALQMVQSALLLLDRQMK